jgi:hypothetical protein
VPRQDTKLEQEGAEFLVLGQLLIEGIPAYKAYTNMRGYDLIAAWPDTHRSARIQVKIRWATDANQFLVKNVDDCDFAVLVRLNRGYRYSAAAKRELPSEDPEYYVLTADDARAIIVDQTTGWAKIRFKKENFILHRRKWDRVRRFLKMPEKQELLKAKKHDL